MQLMIYYAFHVQNCSL